MVEGDHFGEIGLIYEVPRTASIVSRNYNTMARITKDRFRELVSEFPEYMEAIKKNTSKYRY